MSTVPEHPSPEQPSPEQPVSPLSTPGNRFFFALGTLLFGVHFLVMQNYAVDLPFYDEWEVLRPDGMTGAFDLSWLFGFENEHRVVLTKLQTWLLFKLGGWSLAVQLLVNFVLYYGFSLALHRLLQRWFSLPLGFTFLFFASTLPWENHLLGHQSSMHFVLLFFVLAVHHGLREDRRSWLSVLWIALSIYSSGNGLVCGLVFALFSVVLALTRRAQRRRHLLQGALALVLVGAWFIGFHTMGRHPNMTLPWELAFWEHLLNAISLGFGFTETSALPGALWLGAILALLGWRLGTLRRLPAAERAPWLGLCALVLGVGGSLAMVSLGRAGFGAEQAKASRYAEITFLLLPVFWALLQSALARRSEFTRRAVLGLAMFVLAVPFLNDFNFRDVYRAEASLRRESRDCVTEYLRGQGDGDCPWIYPGSLHKHLERGKALGAGFTEYAAFAPVSLQAPQLPLHIQNPQGALTAQLPHTTPVAQEGRCHVDFINGMVAPYYGNPRVVRLSKRRFLNLSGWAVTEAAGKPPSGIRIQLRGATTTYARPARRQDRRDVTAAAGVVRHAGFAAAGSLAQLPPGRYAMFIAQDTPLGERFCDPQIFLELHGPAPLRTAAPTLFSGVCAIDGLQGQAKTVSDNVVTALAASPLELRGWLSDTQRADSLALRLQGKNGAVHDFPMPMAVLALGRSTFSVSAALRPLAGGDYAVKVVARTPGRETECDTRLTLQVRTHFLPRPPVRTQTGPSGHCVIDSVNGHDVKDAPKPVHTTLSSGDLLAVRGWAVDPPLRAAPETMALQLDGLRGNRYVVTATRTPRADVVAWGQEPGYAHAGFVAEGFLTNFEADTYAVRIVQLRGDEEYVCDPDVLITVP